MCPFLFCLAFPLSAAVLIRALPTDWSSVSLWASFSAYALFSFSLSDTIKQKHISKPSERGIFLSFLLLHSAVSFVSTAWFFNLHQTVDLLCVVHLAVFMFCIRTILCKFDLELENVKRTVTPLWGILQLFHPQMILCAKKRAVALSLSLNLRLLLCFVFCLADWYTCSPNIIPPTVHVGGII